MTDFKKGDYVVLLSCCKGENSWERSMPINYCYKLLRDSNKYDFSIEVDTEGYENNGWSLLGEYQNKGIYDNLKFRPANSWEIEEYNKHNKPCKAIKFPDKWCIKVINQEIADYCTEYGECPPYNINETNYAHFPSFDTSCTTSEKIEKGYTEITYNDFQRFILNINTDNSYYLIKLFKKLNIK